MKHDKVALALDRASARTYDQDGHLHVKATPISKANICGYWGREIPDAQVLGLDPNRIYQLLRHPQELAKAADTFNGKPLLSMHRPVTADDHEHEVVAGSVNNVTWDEPYLRADISVWDGSSIRDIENEDKRELSSSYRYRADMTPGTYHGARYDGVMRDITGNHTALVTEGRAGPDVMVGDSKQGMHMTKTKLTLAGATAQGALVAFLRPKLAQDAKIDLGPMLKGVTAKNLGAHKPAIIAALGKAAKGKLAQDASLDDVTELLDALEEVLPDEDEPVALDADETEEEKKAREAKEAKAKADLEDEKKKAAMDATKDMVTKAAMDAALSAAKVDRDAAIAVAVKLATDAATQKQVAIREAEKEVYPKVGALASAFDSAEGVYATALTAMGIAFDGVPPDALKALYKAAAVIPTAQSKAHAPIAQDAAATAEFTKMFPNANRLSH